MIDRKRQVEIQKSKSQSYLYINPMHKHRESQCQLPEAKDCCQAQQQSCSSKRSIQLIDTQTMEHFLTRNIILLAGDLEEQYQRI